MRSVIRLLDGFLNMVKMIQKFCHFRKAGKMKEINVTENTFQKEKEFVLISTQIVKYTLKFVALLGIIRLITRPTASKLGFPMSWS